MIPKLPVEIDTPCGADFSQMTPAGARKRLCASCDKVVHDLSGRTDGEIDALLATGPVCVRYLYDAHGSMLVDAPRGATIVPSSALLSKASRTRWLQAAAVAASAIVFEACGGAMGEPRHVKEWPEDVAQDAGPDTK